MKFNLYNPGKAERFFYDGSKQHCLNPGETKTWVDISESTAALLGRSGIHVTVPDKKKDRALPDDQKAVVIDGMWGIGDNLHQRSILRELMKTREVWLYTCHYLTYHDLVADGLNLIFKSTNLRAQKRTIEREHDMFPHAKTPPSDAHQIKLWYRKDQIDIYGSIMETMHGVCGVPVDKPDFSLPISPEWTEKAKDLIGTWDMGGKPLMICRPVVLRREWNSANRNPDVNAYAALYNRAREGFFVVSIADLEEGKEWLVGPEQYADVKLHHAELDFPAMAALTQEADMVFCNAGFMPVLSQAVGTPSIVVYGGRESFGTTQRAGAHLAPTLGIDTIHPCDCHTERHSCEKRIDVDKAINDIDRFMLGRTENWTNWNLQRAEMPTSIDKSLRVLDTYNAIPGYSPFPRSDRRRTLVYATTYVDCRARQLLTEQWLELTWAVNRDDPDVCLLLIDSASPTPLVHETWSASHPEIQYRVFQFGDNVGHLSRGGRDGWGRAFSKGLEIAVAERFTYAFHIEGDSLFRLPVKPIIAQMARENIHVATIPVGGTVRDMPGWVETGLMCFSVDWLKKSTFVRTYDWRNRVKRPTPEVVVYRICGAAVRMMPWKGLRIDKADLTHETIVAANLDWVTHAHNDIWIYDRFLEDALKTVIVPTVEASDIGDGHVITDAANTRTAEDDATIREFDKPSCATSEGNASIGEMGLESSHTTEPIGIALVEVGGSAPPLVCTDPSVARALTPPPLHGDGTIFSDATRPQKQAPGGTIDCPQNRSDGLKINLGCGTNKLNGWQNHDSDVDITKSLPWGDASADFIFIEHCVEHVAYKDAIGFFEEAFRVLKPGGVLRVTVPSLEQIGACDNPDYWRFTSKWGGEATRKGAMKAIIYAHGHQVAWTASLMRSTLDYVGFGTIKEAQVGVSDYAELRGVEGHGTVIGETFNSIESMPFEAEKPIVYTAVLNDTHQGIAVVVGGAECVWDDLKALGEIQGATYFVINDMIPRFGHPCVAVTLHPDKLPAWLGDRDMADLPKPNDVWAHKAARLVTRHMEAWAGYDPTGGKQDTAIISRGSSGLFAVKIAIQLGFERIVLCGVPMDEGNHFLRQLPWRSAKSFRIGWERRKAEIAPVTRSMSGWTAEILGRPDGQFLGRVEMAA